MGEIVRMDGDGLPLLTQFSEDGFVDLVFRISDLHSTEKEHQFRLRGSYEGEPVGLEVRLRRGMKGGFDDNLDVVGAHVYRDAVVFRSSGVESDRLVRAIRREYRSEEDGMRMKPEISFTAILLHKDEVDPDVDPVKIKLFGSDSPDCLEEDYFESFFNLVFTEGFVYWNEKDQDYRSPLLKGISV